MEKNIKVKFAQHFSKNLQHIFICADSKFNSTLFPLTLIFF